jgi:hypothetical protein
LSSLCRVFSSLFFKNKFVNDGSTAPSGDVMRAAD